jgi:hypothetical protein
MPKTKATSENHPAPVLSKAKSTKDAMRSGTKLVVKSGTKAVKNGVQAVCTRAKDLAHRLLKKARLALSVASSPVSMRSASSLPPDIGHSDTIDIDALMSSNVDDLGDSDASGEDVVPEVDPEEELGEFFPPLFCNLLMHCLQLRSESFGAPQFTVSLTLMSQFNTMMVGFVTSFLVRRASARRTLVEFDVFRTGRTSLQLLTLDITPLDASELRRSRSLRLQTILARAAQSSLLLPAKGRYPSRSHTRRTLM